ncbi:MAG: flagellin [archaeon GB-1867-005]|nr:flagellin [Candidatus Culexmicrobium cathedralense]
MGIVGIEAAIVLIAFVVIAAALASVVINMGFYSSQKAKETINRGLSEASSALQLDGHVIGKTNNMHRLTILVIPVKISVARSEVDLNQNTTIVSVFGGNTTLLNIYNGVVNETGVGLEEDPKNLDEIISSIFDNSYEPAAYCIIYNDDGDSILENFEKAFFIINLGAFSLQEYDKVKIDIKPGEGTALTIILNVPGGLPQNDYVDLG